MIRRFGHLSGRIADYTVGAVIVMVHIATAEWRQRREPARARRWPATGSRARASEASAGAHAAYDSRPAL